VISARLLIFNEKIKCIIGNSNFVTLVPLVVLVRDTISFVQQFTLFLLRLCEECLEIKTFADGARCNAATENHFLIHFLGALPAA